MQRCIHLSIITGHYGLKKMQSSVSLFHNKSENLEGALFALISGQIPQKGA